MSDQPHPPIGAAAYLDLATGMFGPGFSGEGTLSAIGTTQIHGSDHASITETATISAAGMLASKPVGAQVWTFLADLSPGQLLAVCAYLQSNIVIGLQHPEALMYSVLLTLPFLTLEVRAINQRR